MSQLSSKEINAITQLSGLAVNCRTEQQLPEIFFQQITELFGSRSSVYYSMGDDVCGKGVWDGLGYEVAADCVAAYEDNYRQYDPCYLALTQKAKLGEALIVSTDEAIDSRSHYLQSEYYNEFLKPQKIERSLIFAIQDSEGTLGLIGFHRRKGSQPYQSKHYLMAQLLSSQLAQTMRRQLLEDQLIAQQQQNEFLRSHGSVEACITVDSSGTLRSVTGKLKQLPSSPYGNANSDALPQIDEDQLNRILAEFNSTKDKRTVSTLFDNISPDTNVRINGFRNRRQEQLYNIFILPNSCSSLSKDRLKAFSLTPREIAVAEKISLGYTTAQCANALGISPKTVERHLSHIYQKTMVSNRAELIRQLSY